MQAGVVSVVVVGVIVAGVLLMKPQKAQARGIKNNNPLNIKENKRVDFNWVGEHSANLDPDFEEFETPLHGFRAAGRLFKTYRDVHQLNTIKGIVTRWAPPSENDTQNYIAVVNRITGLDVDKPLLAEEYPLLAAAMVQMENGVQPYSMDEITQGINWGMYG